MTTEEHLRLLGITKYHENPTAFVGDKALIGTPLFTQFNFRLRDELVDRLEPGDIVCLPMGHAHENAVTGQPLIKSGEVVAVETGIGYPNPCTIRRIYESPVQQLVMLQLSSASVLRQRTPRRGRIPNYYQLDDCLRRARGHDLTHRAASARSSSSCQAE